MITIQTVYQLCFPLLYKKYLRIMKVFTTMQVPVAYSANVTSFEKKRRKRKKFQKKRCSVKECIFVDKNSIPKTCDAKKILNINYDIYSHFAYGPYSFLKEPQFNEFAKSCGVIYRKHGETTLHLGTAFLIGWGKKDSKYKAFVLSVAHTCRASSTMEEGEVMLDDCKNEKYFFCLSGNSFVDVMSSIDINSEHNLLCAPQYSLECIYGGDEIRNYNRHIHPSNEKIIHSVSGDIAIYGITGVVSPVNRTPFYEMKKELRCFIPHVLSEILKNDKPIEARVIGFHHPGNDEEVEMDELEKFPHDNLAPTYLMKEFKDYLSSVKYQTPKFEELDDKTRNNVNSLILDLVNAKFPHPESCIMMTGGYITNHKIGRMAIAGISTEAGMSGSPLVPYQQVSNNVLHFFGILAGCCIFDEENCQLEDYIYFVQRHPTKLKDKIHISKDGENIKLERSQKCLERLCLEIDKMKPVATLEEILEGNSFITCLDVAFIEAYQYVFPQLDTDQFSKEEIDSINEYRKFIMDGPISQMMQTK